MKIKKISMSEFLWIRDIMKADLEERAVFQIDLGENGEDEVIYHYHNKHDGRLVGIYHDIDGVEEADYYIVIP